MKFLFFFTGVIWPLVSIFVILFGALVGIDRERLRGEIISFWNLDSTPLRIFTRRMLLLLSFFGFLFPIISPMFGLAIGVVFFITFSLI